MLFSALSISKAWYDLLIEAQARKVTLAQRINQLWNMGGALPSFVWTHVFKKSVDALQNLTEPGFGPMEAPNIMGVLHPNMMTGIALTLAQGLAQAPSLLRPPPSHPHARP